MLNSYKSYMVTKLHSYTIATNARRSAHVSLQGFNDVTIKDATCRDNFQPLTGKRGMVSRIGHLLLIIALLSAGEEMKPLLAIPPNYLPDYIDIGYAVTIAFVIAAIIAIAVRVFARRNKK